MDLSILNDRQREAVETTEGPLLVLAGAGSGKTRVLTHRIAYLIQEKGVAPWNILALTFTNKAAGEMRERVGSLLGSGVNDMWVMTFHACCARILRSEIEQLGYERTFVIYDDADQQSLLKKIIRDLNLNEKVFTPRETFQPHLRGEEPEPRRAAISPRRVCAQRSCRGVSGISKAAQAMQRAGF
ncbi:MAG: UvrD-helicase domain-containing protein [Eubacteriales bacterium]